MTEDDLRQLIRDRFPEHGGQTRFARQAGVSRVMVCRVLAGKAPGKKILKALGLKEQKTITRFYTCVTEKAQV